MNVVLLQGFLGPFDLLKLGRTSRKLRGLYNVAELVQICKIFAENEEGPELTWVRVYEIAANVGCMFTLQRQFHLHSRKVLERCFARTQTWPDSFPKRKSSI